MNCVIIVAAGSGTRIGGNIPKQFIEIGGKSILAHTLEKFIQSENYQQYLIVLSVDFLDKGFEIKKANPTIDLSICQGGKERFDSVKNAIQLVHKDCKTISIHDAVRPFISPQLLKQSLDIANKYGSAIPAIAIKDSVRIIQHDSSKIIDRSQLRSIQTPQVFDAEKLTHAYQQDYQKIYTDDASVFEHAGYEVKLFEGDVNNIKITTPEDLEIARLRLAATSA